MLHELLSSSVTSNQGNKVCSAASKLRNIKFSPVHVYFSKRFVDESTNISSNFFSVLFEQEAQLSPSDRAMRLVSSNFANCHATVQKLLIRQVLIKLMYEVGDLVGGSVS